MLSTYKELVRRLESELATIRDEQAKHPNVVAQLSADLEASKLALAQALAQPRPSVPPSNQADSEEQARILTSLSQAYLVWGFSPSFIRLLISLSCSLEIHF